MNSSIKNIIVIGGSYVGRNAAKELAQVIPSTHRVVLVEPHSHFNHLFVFPRFSIVPHHEHMAFIPYSSVFSSAPNPRSHAFVQARVVSVQPDHVRLDRSWQGSNQIPFDYLAVVTGTLLASPGSMKHDDKTSSVEYLRQHQDKVKEAKSVLIIGGGAAGVQMATDLKEYYPDKQVCLAQSRPRLLPFFDEYFHEVTKKRFEELDIQLITGSRAIVPPNGFPTDGSEFEVKFLNGKSITTNFVILATGQKPNNQLVSDLDQKSGGTIINPKNGYIRVRPTLQFEDDRYPNLFAIGDIADTGAQKAARPGVGQAGVVVKNIQAMLEGHKPENTYTPGAAGIHITLGLKKNVVFRNPSEADGRPEPVVVDREDNDLDMGVKGLWQRHGVDVKTEQQYHL